jgi:hypothetical protein
MEGRLLAGKKKRNGKMRKRQCRMKRKETLLPNLLQVRKTANEFSPLSNPLFLSGDIFSSSSPVQSQRAPISQNKRRAIMAYNALIQMTLWCRIMSPSPLLSALSSYIQDFSLSLWPSSS